MKAPKSRKKACVCVGVGVCVRVCVCKIPRVSLLCMSVSGPLWASPGLSGEGIFDPKCRRLGGVFEPKGAFSSRNVCDGCVCVCVREGVGGDDQGGSPQAELRPGSLPTSRITTRELAGWLAGGISWLASWLAGGLAGLLRPRKAQRGPERPGEAQRSGESLR